MRQAVHKPCRISYGAEAHNEGLDARAGHFSKAKLYFLFILYKKPLPKWKGLFISRLFFKPISYFFCNLQINFTNTMFRLINGWSKVFFMPVRLIKRETPKDFC